MIKDTKTPKKARVNALAFADPERIREEIACLESRLDEIGYDGDCAYEKAMIRFFEQEREMRRSWLESH